MSRWGVIASNAVNPTVLLLISAAVISCSDIEVQPSDAESMPGIPNVELFSADIRITRADKPRINITAPHVSRFDKLDLMLLEGGVDAEIFGSDGGLSATLSSEVGEVYETGQKLLARGDVVVKSTDGTTLYADTLYYDPKRDKVISDGWVTIVTELDSLTGIGFVSAPDLKDWEIKNSSGATRREMKQK